MDTTGACDPWHGDPCRDNPVVPDFSVIGGKKTKDNTNGADSAKRS